MATWCLFLKFNILAWIRSRRPGVLPRPRRSADASTGSGRSPWAWPARRCKAAVETLRPSPRAQPYTGGDVGQGAD